MDEIGHALIESVDLNIGGQNIDTIYGRYAYVGRIVGTPGKRLNEMIGKRYQVRDLVQDSSRPYSVHSSCVFLLELRR